MNLRYLTLTLAMATIVPLGAAQAGRTPTTQVLSSMQSVDETVQKLSDAFTERGMKIFTIIDHQAAAREAGLDMQAAKVIIYGAPKAGTPLMQKDPYFALQLPLKVLVTQNQQGQTEVVFETTKTLLENSKISLEEVQKTLVQAEKLITNTVNKK